VGLAAFGPALTSSGVTGQVVQALDLADGLGPTTFDACSPLTNAGAVNGNIALVDRGTCGFPVKARNAQDAGALAVLVANNVAGSPPPGLGGIDPTITIPTVSITQADANTIKANLATGVDASLLLDLSVRAGADPVGNRAFLYTPNPVAPGSTISHWDQSAFPNQLMEPAINADLTHSVQPPEDLTLPLFRDVGWFVDANLNGIPDDVELTALSSQVWIGLKNSDDVGTRFDLLAEALKNGVVVGSGQINNVPGGSSGFNNAAQRAIAMAVSTATGLVSGDVLGFRLSARIGATGHRSGTARLWFNDAAANSRLIATIGGVASTFYLRDGFVLGTSPGTGPKKTIDVTVDRAKNGNAFKAFGTWSILNRRSDLGISSP